MKTVANIFWMVLLGFGVLSSPALAQRDQLFVGARPLALGETFVGIADDGNSTYWNPAGMVFSFRRELNSMYSNLYGLGLHNGFVSLTYPLSAQSAVGANWMYDGFEDEELDYSSHVLALSYAHALTKNIALGGNVKYVNLNLGLDIAQSDPALVEKADGFGADLGALFSVTFKNRNFPRRVQAGVMAHDLTNTKVNYSGEGGGSDVILRRNVRFGASVQLFDKVSSGWLTLSEPLLAVDFDDRWHVGAELWLNHTLALRGGLQNDFEKREGAIPSFGAGLRAGFVQVDYAYTVPPTLGATHRFSVSFRSEANPHWVSIEEIDIGQVFSSLFLSYQNPDSAGFGTLFIKNSSEDTIAATISFNVDGYMARPTEWNVKLAPRGGITPVRVHANFTEKILDIEGDGRRLKGEVKVRYRYLEGTPEESKSRSFFVHGAGAITWDDPGRAAAFVTQHDHCVRSFAERVFATYPLPAEMGWLEEKSEAVRKAMLLYAALRALDLKYLADPNRSQRTVDTIHYPRSLLSGARAAGDCDDLTVLYASLLESCGVETMFLSTRTHFFLMFNTGLRATSPSAHDADDFVVRRNKLWLPMETTFIAQDRGFTEAWEKGAENYRDYASRDDLKLYHVTAQQRRYPSPAFADRNPCSPPQIAAGVIAEQFHAMRVASQRYLERLERLAQRRPDSAAVRNHLGIVSALFGNLPQAGEQFLAVQRLDPDGALAVNNLANVKFMSGDFAVADSLYARALTLDPHQTGAYLNRAMLAQLRREESHEQNDSEGARRFQDLSDRMLTEAAHRLQGDAARAFDLMGYADAEEGGKAELDEELAAKIQRAGRFIDQAFRQYLRERNVKGQVLENTEALKAGTETRTGVAEFLWWGR